MISRIQTVAFQGIDVIPVDVQAQITPGMPAFTIVGLPDKAVGESRERVRSALQSMGLGLPSDRIVINLSPADLQKEGSHFDLPIALALLVSMGILDRQEMEGYVTLGELALDGNIQPVNGVLPAALYASQSNLNFICPTSSGSEASWAQDIQILAPANLTSLLNHFKGTQVLSPPSPLVEPEVDTLLDLQDVKGQETAKRVLEIAAAGNHHLLMCGPPGSGKSMLASRLPSLLPELSPEEALESTMIHSVSGHLKHGKLLRNRPYRDPHHSASQVALVGGGLRALPGEISLAHNGILFLDELPEFNRPTLETLRQPLETGKVTIARANAHVTYPAQVQLIGAMNPCRCGYYPDPERTCGRVPNCARDYQNKISGPLLDRFDLKIDIPAVPVKDLVRIQSGESSQSIKKRVNKARDLQRRRYQQLQSPVWVNAHVDGKTLMQVAIPDEQGQDVLEQAIDTFKLTARSYHRILRVARTIADLAGEDRVKKPHITEALGYRHRPIT